MSATTEIAAELRRVAGLFATGVAVITATGPGSEEPHGMTANGFLSVSLDPPLIAVSVGVRAKLHEVLMQQDRYGVTLLGADLEAEARRFAGQAVDLGPATFRHTGGAPVLSGGLAWMVADIVDRHAAGDHTLFIGQVIDMAVDRVDESPLGFFRSRFSRITPMYSVSPVELDPWSASDHWG